MFSPAFKLLPRFTRSRKDINLNTDFSVKLSDVKKTRITGTDKCTDSTHNKDKLEISLLSMLKIYLKA